MMLLREKLHDIESITCPVKKCVGILQYGHFTSECPVCKQQFMTALFWPDVAEELKRKGEKNVSD